jgi:FkbM family methyltransferase
MKNYSITYNGIDDSKQKFYYSLNSEEKQNVILKINNQYLGVCEYTSTMELHPGVIYYTHFFTKTRDRYAEFIDVETNEVVGMFSLDGVIGYRDVDQNKYIKKILPHLSKVEKNDLNFIFNEIFTNDTYCTDFITVEQGDVVFDIGFNYGLFSLQALYKGASFVYGFEPNKKLVNLFNNNCGSNRVKLFEVAVGSENGKATFFENEWPGKASMDSNVNSDTQTISYNVDVKAFNDILIENNITKIDYLKVDCEGSEYEIFKSMDNKFLKENVNKIAIEFHHPLTDKKVIGLIEKLRITGFETKSIYKDGDTTGMLYCRKLK